MKPSRLVRRLIKYIIPSLVIATGVLYAEPIPEVVEVHMVDDLKAAIGVDFVANNSVTLDFYVNLPQITQAHLGGFSGDVVDKLAFWGDDHLYHKGNYTFKSHVSELKKGIGFGFEDPADDDNFYNSTVAGQVVSKGSAKFYDLSYLTFQNLSNQEIDYGTDNIKDVLSLLSFLKFLDFVPVSFDSVYGGTLNCGEQIADDQVGKGVEFRNIDGNVFFNNINIDASSSGAAMSTLLASGGAIYTGGSTTEFESCSGDVHFNNCGIYIKRDDWKDWAYWFTGYGGAISTETLKITNSGTVIFNDCYVNQVTDSRDTGTGYAYGGAVYAEEGIIITGNDSVTFSNSSVHAHNEAFGGAIATGNLTISNNLKVSFIGNSVETDSGNTGDSYAYGGAIYLDSGSVAEISHNAADGADAAVLFRQNSAEASRKKNKSDILAAGGAIYLHGGATLSFTDNAGNIIFDRNSAEHKGGALYINGSTVNISHSKDSGLKGDVIFSYNNAGKGGAVYLDNKSTLSVANQGNIIFKYNEAAEGGAIYIEDTPELSLNVNTREFIYNHATEYGGAIYSQADTVLGNTGTTEIHYNTADVGGGAIYADGVFTFSGNSNLSIEHNSSKKDGGAVYLGSNGSMYFEDYVCISGNVAQAGGGAFYLEEDARLEFSGGMDTGYSRNEAELGGFIYGEKNSTIYLTGSDKAYLIEDTLTHGDGGAIDTAGAITINGDKVNVTFRDNCGSAIKLAGTGRLTIDNKSGKVVFDSNADKTGSALYLGSGAMTSFISGAVSFTKNSCSEKGGAVYAEDTFLINQSGSHLDFTKNHSDIAGGAIYAKKLEVHNSNGNINFSGNTSESYYYGDGGAVYAESIDYYRNSGDLTFTGNGAAFNGGAIYASTVELRENTGDIVFQNNTAGKKAGAIHASTVNISSNEGNISFIGNTQKEGGAIYATNQVIISANKDVTFQGNTTAIYMDVSEGNYTNGGDLKLSAGEGGRILFDNDAVVLNNKYSSDRALNVLFNTYSKESDVIFRGEGADFIINGKADVKINYGNLIFEDSASMDAENTTLYNHNPGGTLKMSDNSTVKVKYIANYGHMDITNSTITCSKYIRLHGEGSASCIVDLSAATINAENVYHYAGDIHMSMSNGTRVNGNVQFGESAYGDGTSQLDLTGHNSISGNLVFRGCDVDMLFNLSASNALTGGATVQDAALLRADSLTWDQAADSTYTLTVNTQFTKDATDYVLLTLDTEIDTAAFQQRFGYDNSVISWLDDNKTLVYHHSVRDLEWMNAASTGGWNFTHSNWQIRNDDTSLTNIITPYIQGAKVFFTDRYQGEDGTVAINEIIEPEIITVSASRDYTFTDGGGAINGYGKLIKEGSGTLTIALDNGFSGGVEVTGGTLVARKDGALGTGGLKLGSSGTLRIENGARSSLSATNSVLEGQVTVGSASSLELEGTFESVNITGTGTVHAIGDSLVGINAGKETSLKLHASGAQAELRWNNSYFYLNSGAEIHLSDGATFHGNSSGSLVSTGAPSSSDSLRSSSSGINYDYCGPNLLTVRNGANLHVSNGSVFSYDGSIVIESGGVATFTGAGNKLGNSTKDNTTFLFLHDNSTLNLGVTEESRKDSESCVAVLDINGTINGSSLRPTTSSVLNESRYKIHVDAHSLTEGETYVLITLDSRYLGEKYQSEYSDIRYYTDEADAAWKLVTVTGVDKGDLKWDRSEDGLYKTLYYTYRCRDLIWGNLAGTGTWDKVEYDWNPENPVVYGDGMNVIFNDICQDNEDVSITTDVTPAKITVDATRDYTFTDGGGSITGNSSLIKSGTGTLMLALENDFSGGIQLQEGVLALAHDLAAGTGALHTAQGTELKICQSSDVKLADSAIYSNVKVEAGSYLTFESPSAFAAQSVTANGNLTFSNTAKDVEVSMSSLVNNSTVSFINTPSVSIDKLSSITEASHIGNMQVINSSVTIQQAPQTWSGSYLISGADAQLVLATPELVLAKGSVMKLQDGGTLDTPSLTISGNAALYIDGTGNELTGTFYVQDNSEIHFSISTEDLGSTILTAGGMGHLRDNDAKFIFTPDADLAAGTYTIMVLDTAPEPNHHLECPDGWFPMIIYGVDSDDLEWCSTAAGAYTKLLYHHNTTPYSQYIWTNQSGDELWNLSSYNWKHSGTEDNCLYEDNSIVYFNDLGSSTSTNTVIIDVAANGGNAYKPRAIEVISSQDYTFVSNDGTVQQTHLSGCSLNKKGSGTLTIDCENNFNSVTVDEGTLALTDSKALGDSCLLTTAADSHLIIGQSSVEEIDVTLSTESTRLYGEVTVEAGSTLRYTVSNGYNAGHTTVDGTLAFENTAVGIYNAGPLSGTGDLKHTGAAGSVLYFATADSFAGNMEVGSNNQLIVGSGEGYSCASGKQLVLRDSASATFTNQQVTLKEGATLSMNNNALFKTDTLVSNGGAITASGIDNVVDTTELTLNNATLNLTFDNRNAVINDGESFVLTLNGSFTTENNLTINLGHGDADDGETYAILQLADGSMSQEYWQSDAVTINTTGNGSLFWNTDYTKLYYYVPLDIEVYGTDRIWDNGSGNREWNFADLNWNADTEPAVDIRYRDNTILEGNAAINVRFEGAGQGNVKITDTVTPGDILVTAGDYTFTDGGGEITGDASLTKTGDGTLTLSLDNSFSGGTALKEGTLCVAHDEALGSGKLTTEQKTLLHIAHYSEVHLAAEGTDINGKVQIDKDSSLTFEGEAASQDIAELSGEGKLAVHADKAEYKVTESRNFDGDISVSGTETEVTLLYSPTKSSDSHYFVSGSGAALKLLDQEEGTPDAYVNHFTITLEKGGSIQVVDGASFVTDALHIEDEAVLIAGSPEWAQQDAALLRSRKVIFPETVTLDAALTLYDGAVYEQYGTVFSLAENYLYLRGEGAITLMTNLDPVLSNGARDFLLFTDVGGMTDYSEGKLSVTVAGYEANRTELIRTADGNVYVRVIPEPTTATLSLLALAALAARRRRK